MFVRKMVGIALVSALSAVTTINTHSATLDTYLSQEIQGYCEEIGQQYGICPELLMAMIEKESSGNPKAENGSCKGLMQISEIWHKDRMEYLCVTDIYEPYGNILLGADYIMELAEEYEDIGLVLMKYNGFSKAESYANQGKLSDYAEWILERSALLEELHERSEKSYG